MNTSFHNMQFCEKEQSVAMTMRSGALPEDLLIHVGSCPVCTEVALISHSLMQNVVLEELHVPNAGLIWRRAQSLARQQAIASATRPIRIARFATLAAAIVALQ